VCADHSDACSTLTLFVLVHGMGQLDQLHRQRKREEMELAAFVKQEERVTATSSVNWISTRQKKSLSPNRAQTSIPATRTLSPESLVRPTEPCNQKCFMCSMSVLVHRGFPTSRTRPLRETVPFRSASYTHNITALIQTSGSIRFSLCHQRAKRDCRSTGLEE